MTRHSYFEENKHELPGSIPAWSGDENPRSILEEGGKVTPTLPTPLPRRSLSSASGGGSIPPLVAVSHSKSSRLLLLVSMESESLQQHSVTLADNTLKSERTKGSSREHTPGSASMEAARIRWRRPGGYGLERSMGLTLPLRPRPPAGSTPARDGWCPSTRPAGWRRPRRWDLEEKALPPPSS